MKYKIGDVLTIKGEEYPVVDAILYEGRDYILVNKFENDEPTENYIPYEVVAGGLVRVENKAILEKLIPIFSANLQKMVEFVNLKEKYDID